MDTPWGPLAQLDPCNDDLAMRIIAEDKDTLVEGLVVEDLFDQFLGLVGHGVSILDLETAIAAVGSQRYAFVWSRVKSQRGLGRYLNALEQVTTRTFVVRFLDGEFWAAPRVDGRVRAEERRSLTFTVEALTGRRAKHNSGVDAGVRDTTRQLRAFWGNNLQAARDPHTRWERIILPRLFLNHGLGPYFPRLWNLDRICVTERDVWLLEAKHKYPFQNRAGLMFGINHGEMENVMLLSGGPDPIRCLHVLMVKPKWERGIGPLYLLNDLEMRQRVAVIAMDLSTQAARILANRSVVAPAHTAFSGRGGAAYHSVPATDFHWIGWLTDRAESIANGLFSMLSGMGTPPKVQDGDLNALRIS